MTFQRHAYSWQYWLLAAELFEITTVIFFSRLRHSQFIESTAQDRLVLKAAWRRAYETHDPTVLTELDEVSK